MDFQPAEIRALRLRSQLLLPGSGPVVVAGELAGPVSPAALVTADGFDAQISAAVVERLFALQGQDFAAVKSAIALRARIAGATVTSDEINDMFNRAVAVRSWPFRGTVHVLPARDIGWVQSSTNHRVLKDWPKRRENLELPMGVVERVIEITRKELAGGLSLARKDLIDHWEDAGISMGQGWPYHLVWALCQTGVTTFGPVSSDGKDLQVVLAEDWIKEPRMLEGDEALRELAVRYLAGHGPATVQDFVWWTKLTAAEAKRGFKAAGSEVVSVTCEGVEYWALAESIQDKPVDHDSGLLHFLPAFDEYLLGYKDRSLAVEPQYAKRIMTSNGIAKPTVVYDGMVIGTWNVRNMSVELFETGVPAGVTAGAVQEKLLSKTGDSVGVL